MRDVAEERVCSCLGIPAAIVGFGAGLQSTKVGATMNEMRKLAWINGIIPIHRSFADTLHRSLMPDFMRGSANSEVVEFDTSQVTALEEDMNERATRWNALVTGGWVMVGEGRRAMGLDTDDSHNVFLRRAAIKEVLAVMVEPKEGETVDGEATTLAYPDDAMINERRKVDGLEPVPGGDVIHVDANKIEFINLDEIEAEG